MSMMHTFNWSMTSLQPRCCSNCSEHMEFLAFPGEAMLNTARAFAIDRLQQQMMPSSMVGGSYFQEDLPLHWRAPRLQAIRSLKHHRSDCSGDEIASCIMQLAAEDFDRVQAVHQSELVELTRWWKETKLGEKLPLSARDRLVECFFCATCIAPEPRHAGCRDVLAKVGSLIVHLDDIYDVYGTIDELATFTDAIAGNWDDDDDATALLPEYMQAMLSVIRSTSMAAADRVLREHGHDVLPVWRTDGSPPQGLSSCSTPLPCSHHPTSRSSRG